MRVMDRLIGWYGKRVVYGGIALIAILVVIGGYFLFFKGSATEDTVALNQKRVEVKEASALGEDSIALNTVGTVRAISEARLQTESAGRVTAVNVAIGDTVAAGTVLAAIENSRERAALTSAEGAYESALAGSAQAGISLREAEVGSENAYRSAYTTTSGAIYNLADELFADPDGFTPGIRVDAQGDAIRLGNERIAIGTLLEEWDAALKNGSPSDKLALLNNAERDTTRIANFITELTRLMNDEDPGIFSAEEITSYKTRLSGAQSSLSGVLASLSGARNALLSAQQASQGGAVSSDAEARVKSALGALRAAQAQYEKTLVRSPISGVVNALYLRANEYVGMNAPAAVVANNGALEITTSVSEEERALIAVGDTVEIRAQDATIEGTITRVAPAIDPQTGKIEVKVSVPNDTTLQNGVTVSLSLKGTGAPKQTTQELRVPLRALKITAEGPIAFSVENGALKAHPVELGAIVGDLVVVKSGIERTTAIVTDARGLKEGELVEITSN